RDGGVYRRESSSADGGGLCARGDRVGVADGAAIGEPGPLRINVKDRRSLACEHDVVAASSAYIGNREFLAAESNCRAFRGACKGADDGTKGRRQNVEGCASRGWEIGVECQSLVCQRHLAIGKNLVVAIAQSSAIEVHGEGAVGKRQITGGKLARGAIAGRMQ